MKLIAIENSSLTSLFHATRLEGQPYLPLVAAGLVERYSFADAPKSLADLTADRLEFKHGLFEGSAIDKIEIYRDGIVVASGSDTEFLDRFLENLLQWTKDDLGFSIVRNRTIDKVYESHIIVQMDERVLSPLLAFSDVASLIGNLLKENSGLDLVYSPAAFMFASDESKNPSLKPVTFRLERRLASEFQFNQFISAAPLTTKQHLQVLEALESLP